MPGEPGSPCPECGKRVGTITIRLVFNHVCLLQADRFVPLVKPLVERLMKTDDCSISDLLSNFSHGSPPRARLVQEVLANAPGPRRHFSENLFQRRRRRLREMGEPRNS